MQQQIDRIRTEQSKKLDLMSSKRWKSIIQREQSRREQKTAEHLRLRKRFENELQRSQYALDLMHQMLVWLTRKRLL